MRARMTIASFGPYCTVSFFLWFFSFISQLMFYLFLFRSRCGRNSSLKAFFPCTNAFFSVQIPVLSNTRHQRYSQSQAFTIHDLLYLPVFPSHYPSANVYPALLLSFIFAQAALPPEMPFTSQVCHGPVPPAVHHLLRLQISVLPAASGDVPAAFPT
jgi:hypothetical protein